MQATRPNSLRSKFTSLVDAFAWPLRASHYLELANPLWTTHALQARVEAVWDETADARTLTLKPGYNWRSHRPGQHVRLGVPIGGMHYTRTYSISSAPERDDGCITVTVKAIAQGRMSQHLVRRIKVGDYLPIGVPQGDFYLPDAAPLRPLFITAGSGITPIMSMLRSAVARDRMPDMVHLHYAPHAYDVIFGQELQALAQQFPRYHLKLIYTRETDKEKRHFSAEMLDDICPDWRSRETFACGPQALLDAVEAHWQQAGLSRALHLERFRAREATAPTTLTTGRVRFSKSGVDIESDGATNLLRLAENAGLNPNHGCRMGMCHSCDVPLKGGSVRDLRTNALITEVGQTVQICVCAAAGDAEFDL